MRKRTVAALIIVLLAALVLSGVVPTPTRAWSAGSTDVAAENRLAYLVNREHIRVCGRGMLRAYPHNNVDRWRAKDMVVRDYFSHTILGTSKKAWNYFAKYGNRDWKGAGENIGWNNYPDNVAADAIFQMFMASPGHRGLIQACAYNTFGVGAYKGPTGKKMFVTTFSVQPVERIIVRKYAVKVRPYAASRTKFYVYYHARQVVFRHTYNRYHHRWDYGAFPGKGWGWAYDARTR